MRTHYTPVFIVLITLVSCTSLAPVAPLPAADTLVYVMAGQSNMCGRGELSPADILTNPRVLGMDGSNHFLLKTEPDVTQQGFLAGLDCGASFGASMLPSVSAGTSIGLAQCAISSTGIREWLGDSLHVFHLYSNMLARARAGRMTGTLKGVLWHQGETDADDSVICKGYAQLLQAFIQKFRNDVGQPALPFFIGRLAAWCKKPYKDSVNAGIEATAAALQNIYIIPTDDLTPKIDSIHFDAAGQRELGKRFAAMAARLL